MIIHVMWQSQAKNDGKSNDEQVPGRIHVSKLQIGDSNGSDHSKHYHENSTNDGIWDGDKQGSNFTKNTHEYHYNGTELNHTQTSNLKIYRPFFISDLVSCFYTLWSSPMLLNAAG